MITAIIALCATHRKLTASDSASQFGFASISLNSKNQPLERGKYIDEVCTRVTSLQERNEICRACQFWQQCRGGCRALGTAMTNDRMGADLSKCIYYKGRYIEKTDEVMSRCGYERT